MRRCYLIFLTILTSSASTAIASASQERKNSIDLKYYRKSPEKIESVFAQFGEKYGIMRLTTFYLSQIGRDSQLSADKKIRNIKWLITNLEENGKQPNQVTAGAGLKAFASTGNITALKGFIFKMKDLGLPISKRGIISALRVSCGDCTSYLERIALNRAYHLSIPPEKGELNLAPAANTIKDSIVEHACAGATDRLAILIKHVDARHDLAIDQEAFILGIRAAWQNNQCDTTMYLLNLAIARQILPIIFYSRSPAPEDYEYFDDMPELYGKYLEVQESREKKSPSSPESNACKSRLFRYLGQVGS